jgi:hypothetical protein
MKYLRFTICCWLLVGNIAFAQSKVNTLPDAVPMTVPSGTHMLTKLVSPLNTVSATKGSAVYLETTMPVIVDNRVAIPAGTKVIGTVLHERRSGRVKGRAQLRIGFTNFIFADNRVVAIEGAVQGLPRSSHDRRVDAEGTIEPVDQLNRDVKTVVTPAIPGAILAALGAGIPGMRLALLGGGLGLGNTMFTRGDEISLPVGTPLEMVLKRDLQLDSTRLDQGPAQEKPQEPAKAQPEVQKEDPCECYQE